MIFQWQDYLELAKRLVNEDSPNEASLRSAVSRAYYAAFNIAAQVLMLKHELVLAGLGEDHTRVINHFLGSTDTKRHDIGVLLRHLRDDRNKADYVASISYWEFIAQLNIGRVDRVLQFLKEI